MAFRDDLLTESRIKSANDKKQTPLKLFPDAQSGIFASSEGGFYETTLEKCSCPDFAIQGHLQPCKHMIRLAMEFGLIDSSEMQSDRNAAVVKYHTGFFREYIRNADLADVIAAGRNFLAIAYEGAKTPDNAFTAAMDLPTLSDCPLFKVQKNGIVKIEKKYEKDAQSILTIFKHRIADEAMLRIWSDEFVYALIHAGVVS